MFTVKLMRQAVDENSKTIPGRFSTKIMEAPEVGIHVLEPGDLIEIAVGSSVAYIVPRNRAIGKFLEDWSIQSYDAYFIAYVENAAGKTTEIVECSN